MMENMRSSQFSVTKSDYQLWKMILQISRDYNMNTECLNVVIKR